MKILIKLLITSFLISCNAYKDIPVHELKIDMNVEQVQEIVKRPLVQVSMSSDSDGEKRVFQVQKRIVRGGIARQQRYNIYFLNGRLLKYEKDSESFSF
jgi:hypothetical protein